MKRALFFYTILLLCSSFFVIDASIGSDTAVQRFSSQVVLQDGDVVKGFAALEGGFELFNSDVVATFDSFFPVSGDIALNGGLLTLVNDLIMHNLSTLSTLGSIVGNGHILELSASTNCIPSIFKSNDLLSNDSDDDSESMDDLCFEWSNLSLVLNCNVTMKNCCIKFSGDSVINGNGHCLTLSPECEILVDENSCLLLKNITIKGVNDQRIQGCADTSKLSLKNVEWVLDDDYTFGTGYFEVLKDFKIVGGGHTFSYESSQVSTVQECGNIILERGVTLCYDPPTDNRDLFQLVAPTSQLSLRSAQLKVSSDTGLDLTTGVFDIDGKSRVVVNNESGTIGFGDGVSSDNNLNVQVNPAAQLYIVDGCVVLNDV